MTAPIKDSAGPSHAGPVSATESDQYPSVPEECAIGDSDDDDEELVQMRRAGAQSRMQHQKSPEELRRAVIPFHWAPMLSPLIPADLPACVTLEHAALPDQTQSCSAEQIEYCIRKCGGICLGLFNTCPSSNINNWHIQTLPHARPVETSRQDQSKSVLFAHILATLGKHTLITDEDLQLPSNWRDAQTSSSHSSLGHQISGRTICLHSFSVCPEVQGVGIGKSAMKAYVELMNQSGVADRISLICKQPLVSFFTKVGFKSAGKSKTTVVGSDWHNMSNILTSSLSKTLEFPGSQTLASLD
ncbi:hypothetical protein E4U43_006615 [Claviceps pusilla]|uniref:N-acetyltransferase domain-containing protein n=1 Tax=Claviceps pusilla TaxID=123648 RepID=A0A9P7N1P6_9HYPO|nr:hypothetical protein E4U43_006615 [Claviceps pusilla]